MRNSVGIAYKTADHIHENWSLGLPLVGLLLSHEFTYSPSTVFVIHKNGRRDFTNLSFVPLAFDDSVGVERGARHWAPAKILCDTNDLLLPSCATGLSGLLLMKPEYCSIMPLPEEFPKPMYHVATVEWRTRNGNGGGDSAYVDSVRAVGLKVSRMRGGEERIKRH